MTREMSQLFIAELNRVYAGGQTVHGFHDWLAMSNYDSACRIDLTQWILAHRKQSIVHIALGSRLVAMGVSVANLALGNALKVYTSVDALERAYVETLETKRH